MHISSSAYTYTVGMVVVCSKDSQGNTLLLALSAVLPARDRNNPSTPRELALRNALCGSVFQKLVDLGKSLRRNPRQACTTQKKDLSVSSKLANCVHIRVVAGASVTKESPGQGATVLMHCAQAWHLGGVRTVLAKGGDPNIADKKGFTALIVCCTAEHQPSQQGGQRQPNAVPEQPLRGDSANALAVAQLLLANGADVNSMTEDGVTALSEAVSNGMPDMVTLLCAAGASADRLTSQGWTARSLATSFVLSPMLVGNGVGMSKKKKGKGAAATVAEYKRSIEIEAAIIQHSGLPQGNDAELVQAVHFSSLLAHFAVAFNNAGPPSRKAARSFSGTPVTPAEAAELKRDGYAQDLAVLQLLMQAAGLPAGSTAAWTSGDMNSIRDPVTVVEWMRGCTFCGVVPGQTDGICFKRCSACGVPRYCSTECQRKDWKKNGGKWKKAHLWVQF